MYLIEIKGYPTELPYIGTDEEILEKAREELITSPTSEESRRVLTEDEIADHRTAYTQIIENDEIELINEIISTENQLTILKERAKDLKERHSALRVEINDHVKAIKQGYVDELLIPELSVALNVDNKKLHYTLEYGALVLAQVTHANTQSVTLFEQQHQNQEKFLELFGVEFTPETRFEIVSVKEAKSRTLAKSVTIDSSEEVVDEDTGELYEVPRKLTLAQEGCFIGEGLINTFISHDIDNVIVYVEASAQEGAKE